MPIDRLSPAVKNTLRASVNVMPESVSVLSAWESFYVIVGSSGGALIGLQFVVITLISERRSPGTLSALKAFGTPTVVHLTVALAVSAIMSAPWASMGRLSAALIGCGVAGLVYGAVTIWRAVHQTEYQPVWQDWLWYDTLPLVTYLLLAIGAAMLRGDTAAALFLIATAALGLLLISIHNAWDTVTHIVFVQNRQEQ